MSDDLKKYWDSRRKAAEQAPHHRPAHETQGVRMPNMPDFGRGPNGPAPQQGDRDISGMLQQRLQNQMVQNQMGGGASAVADLQEGLPYYTSVENSFGGTTPLIRTAGVIRGATAKGVQIKREVRGYLIDGMASVDMSQMKHRPDLMVTLVEVAVPFMGTFLVPKEAVMRRDAGPMGDGRSLLKG